MGVKVEVSGPIQRPLPRILTWFSPSKCGQKSAPIPWLAREPHTLKQ